MRLNTIINLLLLFCLFKLVLNDNTYTLSSKGTITINGNGEGTSTVQLDSGASYDDYISLIFTIKNSIFSCLITFFISVIFVKQKYLFI